MGFIELVYDVIKIGKIVVFSVGALVKAEKQNTSISGLAGNKC